MDAAQVEGIAIDFYRRLKLDPASPVDAFRLARLFLGPGSIERGTSIIGAHAKVFRVNGVRRIAVSRKLPVEYQQFGVAHELGHLILEEENYQGDNVEASCDALGAALMAPMPAVRAMLSAFGRDHEAIANEVVSTQTWAALRVAECLGITRAIVTPARIYARGPEAFVWGDPAELRRLACARKARPGIHRVRLTDDPRRVVLDVEAVGDE